MKRTLGTVDEQDSRFYVGRSTIPGAGDGLFARVALRAGDRLAVLGVTIPSDSVSDRCTRYADEHKYRVGDLLVIPLGYAAMVNHSASPNMAKVYEDGELYLAAVRDIAEHEELSFAYNPRALERFGLLNAVVDTLPSDQSSTFTNTGAAGINRLVDVDGVLLVDNIGRNFEFRQIEDAAGPAWIQRALYDITIFPGEDNPSILDNDVHGAFLTADRTRLLVGNHFGRVRCFAWPFPVDSVPHRPAPLVELQLPGDTERLAFDGRCFITSSPRGAYTPDAPRPGIFISEPIQPLLAARTGELRCLDCRSELADWGVITALALESSSCLLAVAAGTRLALFRLERDDSGTRCGQPLWETELPYGVQWLAFDAASRHVIAGGHTGSGQDAGGDDWDACTGGTMTLLTTTGAAAASLALPDATAWGYGCDPIVFAPDGETAYVVDRAAGVHAIDVASRSSRCLHPGVASVETASLGIGHAVRGGRFLYAGFSRGGYRVFRTELV